MKLIIVMKKVIKQQNSTDTKMGYDTVLATVPYQLCPKCGGDGTVMVQNWNGSPTSISNGLQTEQFHKVNLVCLSPNHWTGNNVGNKHYFLMLDNCKCHTSIRSFHAENLIPELAQHRKVLEVLGNTTMIEPSEKQLSGLGFNATVKDELIVKLTGSHKRVIKIKF
jgi:hypothetical protein